MAKCEICGKTPQFGHKVSHSMRHTNRQWKPNIQKTKIMQGKQVKTLHICSRCMRTIYKQEK